MAEIRDTFQGVARTDCMLAIEVEQTPAFNLLTLFVQAEKPAQYIIDCAKRHNATHVYLGANRSFGTILQDWNSLILTLLDNDLKVTLDYNVVVHEWVVNHLTPSVWEHDNFIPLITVDIPYLNKLSNNLTVKFDDNATCTNNGVWCWNHSELVDPAKFTGWAEYTGDVSVE